MTFTRYFFLLFTLLFTIAGFAQIRITGTVQDESGKSLGAASIFLSGTSFGTMANDKGYFGLSGMAQGKYDLVVSCMGYQTHSQSIDTRQITEPIIIVLKPKLEELENVTIGPGEEVPWEMWGKFFMDNFIGTTPESRDCIIENPSVIRFRHFHTQQLIRATASKPLIITNKALGYTITYQLEYFQYDFQSKILYFLGYALFKEMETKNERRKQQYEQNRMQAFYGSQLHFMRSLYRDKQLEEGFEMRKLVKQPNVEKERIRNIMKQGLTLNGKVSVSLGNGSVPTAMDGKNDSSSYYSQVLQQPNEIDILYAPILPGDSVAYQINPYTAGFEFSDYLQITYIKEKEHIDYLNSRMEGNRKRGFQTSLLKMNEPKVVEIGLQGEVNDPLILLSTGYWAWSEKIATMLPSNYWPAKDGKK